jgi:hypothetical protein
MSPMDYHNFSIINSQTLAVYNYSFLHFEVQFNTAARRYIQLLKTIAFIQPYLRYGKRLNKRYAY